MEENIEVLETPEKEIPFMLSLDEDGFVMHIHIPRKPIIISAGLICFGGTILAIRKMFRK